MVKPSLAGGRYDTVMTVQDSATWSDYGLQMAFSALGRPGRQEHRPCTLSLVSKPTNAEALEWSAGFGMRRASTNLIPRQRGAATNRRMSTTQDSNPCERQPKSRVA